MPVHVHRTSRLDIGQWRRLPIRTHWQRDSEWTAAPSINVVRRPTPLPLAVQLR
jgi:hypothetical protein